MSTQAKAAASSLECRRFDARTRIVVVRPFLSCGRVRTESKDRHSQATNTLTTIFVSSARASVRWDALRTFVFKLREKGQVKAHQGRGMGGLNDLLF